MIARHITTHDETGMRLLAIGREIYRTPTQDALGELAMELASREGEIIYAQQRCMDGAAISKAYHNEGRVIVDSVYFSTTGELKRLYTRAPLGDGLFFANAPRLERTYAMQSPASETLKADAPYEDFTNAVNVLFPDEDSLSDVVCALRTQKLPLAAMSDMDDVDFSRKLYMALELILRSLPAEAAARLNFITLCGGETPCNGLTGYAAGENPDIAQYISLPGGARSIDVIPSSGDYARADALLAGTLDDVMDTSLADDDVPAINVRQISEASKEAAAARDAETEPDNGAAPTQSDLEKAQQTLSASLRYANSHEFRRFTSGFLHLRTGMDALMYFRYCLKYSDYLHRLDHPMCEIYDAELAALYQQPPTGLKPVQIALTLTGYPGALSGTITHIDKAGVLDKFIMDTLPLMNVGVKPEEYAQSLLTVRATLMACLTEDKASLVRQAIAHAVSSSMPEAVRRISAASLCSVRDALAMLIDEEPMLSDGAFDPAMSDIIDRIEFKRMDEHAVETYPALDFAYSYVRQWDGQVTDKQRAVFLWGRLMDGCNDWHGCVMDCVLRLLAPMNPVNRVDFMGFIRRYFSAMCDGGLERSQMSESVVIITMLTALRFDSQNNWRIDELSDVLDRLDEAGEGLVGEFWVQVNTREDLLPMDMLNEAHEVAGGRGDNSLRPTRSTRRQRSHDRRSDYDDDYLEDRSRRYQDEYDNAPHTGTRSRISDARYPRKDERTRRDSVSSRQRDYDAILAQRASTSYGEHVGSPRQTGGRAQRRRDYSYDPDDPDSGRTRERDFGIAMARYRAKSGASSVKIPADTVMLWAMAVIAMGMLAFCVIKFVL